MPRCNEILAKRGDHVKLMEAPDGCLSKFAQITVGSIYVVKDIIGSCLEVSTDVPGDTASLWRGRFVLAALD